MMNVRFASPFQNLDNVLGDYYASMGRDDYFDNTTGDGKFMKYLIEQELDDPNLPLVDELGSSCDPYDCSYTDFDDGFPIPIQISVTNATQKELFIFCVIQFCWINNKHPTLKQCINYQNIQLKLNDKDGQSDNNNKDGVDYYEAESIAFESEFRHRILQNKQGPSPLIALLNALLLNPKFRITDQMPKFDYQMSVDQLIEALQTLLDDLHQNDKTLLIKPYSDLLQNLESMLRINIKHNDVNQFVINDPVYGLFKILGLNVYHCWAVNHDGKYSKIYNLLSDQTYYQLKNINLFDKMNTTQYNQLINDFLQNSSQQTTKYGIHRLYESMKDNEIAILYHHNKYSTIYKRGNDHIIYELVTDKHLININKQILFKVFNPLICTEINLLIYGYSRECVILLANDVKNVISAFYGNNDIHVYSDFFPRYPMLYNERLKQFKQYIDNNINHAVNGWRLSIDIGTKVDMYDKSYSRWYPGEIVGVNNDQVEVHYTGYDPDYNEHLNKNSIRLEPIHTYTPMTSIILYYLKITNNDF